MRLLPALVAFAVISMGAVSSTPSKSTSKRKKKPAASRVVAHSKAAVRPRPVVVSPVLRKEAFERIAARMTPHSGHIENPEALASFLTRVATNQPADTPIHILQFGDSHTASDDWVDAMRRVMQARFGNGGAGFGMAGRPFKGYRRFDLRGNNSPGWETEGTVSHPGDGLAGLSGISLTSHAAGETIWADTAADDVELYYLNQPGGGSFSVELDGAPVETVKTDGQLSSGVYRFSASASEHVFAIRTLSSAPVRMYGWVSQNRTGVTWETLGINGAQAAMMLHWDETLWGQQIAQRNPSLVVLAYGTNEANSRTFDPSVFRSALAEIFARLRRAVPDASILLVGPPDCGRSVPLLHLNEVIEVERVAAAENHIAFWDWRQRMGGARSVVWWGRTGLGQPDSIHLTGAGYRMTGQALAGDITGEIANK